MYFTFVYALYCHYNNALITLKLCLHYIMIIHVFCQGRNYMWSIRKHINITMQHIILANTSYCNYCYGYLNPVSL